MVGRTHASEARDAPVRGIVYLVAGISVFSFQDVLIRALSGAYAVHEIVFVRSLVALPLLVLVLWLGEGLAALRTRRPLLHLVRGAFLLAAYTLYYMAIAAMPLADAVALFFSAPLLITLIAIPALGERVGPRRWLGVAVGFAGVLVMLRPGASALDPAAGFALGAALAYAAGAIVTRRLGASDGGAAMAFSTTLLYLVVTPVLALVVAGTGDGGDASLAFLTRPWRLPTTADLGLMAACGAIAAFGFLFLSQAYRAAPASTVAPFEYVGLPWAVLWGYAVWGELPGPATLVGVALVVGAGLYVLRRESARGRRIAAGRGLRPRI